MGGIYRWALSLGVSAVIGAAVGYTMGTFMADALGGYAVPISGAIGAGLASIVGPRIGQRPAAES